MLQYQHVNLDDASSLAEHESQIEAVRQQSAAKLAKIGVQTATDLAALDPDIARALTNVTGGRTVSALRVYLVNLWS